MTDKDFTLGVAMIARNGAKTMKQALKPFIGKVDEIAIVLGGESTDATPSLARKLGTKIANYDGPLSDVGALLDFSAARQQSFDLCATDWVIVVDTDDEWFDAENIAPVVAECHPRDVPCIWVPYELGDGFFHQPRVFRRTSGHWQNPIHEEFVFYDDLVSGDSAIVKTGEFSLSQLRRKNDEGKGRSLQNIEIGKAAAEADPANLRTWAQLASDLIVSGEYDEAVSATNHYLENWGKQAQPIYTDELAYVWAKRASSQLRLRDYGSSYLSAGWSLGIKETASGHCYKAEAAVRMAMQIGVLNDPLDVIENQRGYGFCKEAIYHAEQAMRQGKNRTGYAEARSLATWRPCSIAALAYTTMRQPREALTWLDLGLSINPDDELMTNMRADLCAGLNEVP